MNETTITKNKFYFNWHQIYDTNCKSDIFYHDYGNSSPVVDISFNGNRIMITCDGEMNFIYKGERVRQYRDLSKCGINTDIDWLKALDDDQDYPEGFMPWFDAYEYNDSVNDWEHIDMVSGHIDDIILTVQKYLLNKYRK